MNKQEGLPTPVIAAGVAAVVVILGVIGFKVMKPGNSTALNQTEQQRTEAMVKQGMMNRPKNAMGGTGSYPGGARPAGGYPGGAGGGYPGKMGGYPGRR